jgi:hypothetical protein
LRVNGLGVTRHSPLRGSKASRALSTLAGVSLVAAGIAAIAGCPSTTATTTTYTPITGIEILASELTAGHGCSNDPSASSDAVFRYGAVVSAAPDSGAPDGGTGPWSDVFECFTNGVFENLPVNDGGNQLFDLVVYAWTEAGFPPELAPCADAGACLAHVPFEVLHPSKPPEWTTTCTANQQQGIPVLAVCGPLQPTGAGLTAGGPPEAGPDAMDAGEPDVDATLTPDAGDATLGTAADAAPDTTTSADASEAGDAGTDGPGLSLD